MNKVCFSLTPLKKPGFLLHSNFSKLAPLERIQMGWPTITYNSSKYQSSHMPCEGQIQSEDLYCSQVIQSRCQLQQVRVWKLAGITISESLQTFCSGIKGALFLFFNGKSYGGNHHMGIWERFQSRIKEHVFFFSPLYCYSGNFLHVEKSQQWSSSQCCLPLLGHGEVPYTPYFRC